VEGVDQRERRIARRVLGVNHRLQCGPRCLHLISA
jgi:hypothetical protein